MRAVFFFLAAFASALVFAQSKEELSELRSRIEALTQELNESEKSKSNAAGALKEVERAISKAKRELAQLNEELEQSRVELVKLEARSRELEAGIADEKTHFAALLRQMHRSGEQEALKLFLGGEGTLSRDLEYYSHLAQARSELLQTIKTDWAALHDVTAAAKQKSVEIEELKERQARDQLALEEQRKERAQLVQQLAQQIRAQRDEISTLKHDESRLAKLIARLAKAIPKSPKPRVLENERAPGPQSGGVEFERLKGSLSLPVRGELTSRFGAPREDSSLTWKGLLILAQAGAAVKAIASGKVVFADWLRGFGNLMIVDHGEGYMSLYGNNETLHRQVGEQVRAGDVIAEVGASGASRDPGLYFEMRHQGKPFDPLTWVRLK